MDTKHARSRSYVNEQEKPHLTSSQATSPASDPQTRRLQDFSDHIKTRQSGKPEHRRELLTEYVPTRNLR